MHAENCVVLRVTARGNQTRGKDAAAVEQEEKGMRGGSGGGGGVGLAVAEGSFTCCRCAPFLFFFFYISHSPRAYATGWRQCRGWTKGGCRAARRGGWDSRVVLFANMLPIRRRIDVCLLFDVAAVAGVVAGVVSAVVNSST